MIREGAVLVDVGVSRTPEGKIQGDFTADVWEKGRVGLSEPRWRWTDDPRHVAI